MNQQRFNGIDAAAIDRIVDDNMLRLPVPEGTTQAQILAIAGRFKRIYRGKTFHDVSEIFDICDAVDADPSTALNPRLQVLARRVRQQVSQAVLDAYFEQKRTMTVGQYDKAEHRAMDAEELVAHTVSEMIPALKSDAPPTFDQHWLKARFTKHIASLEPFLKNKQTGVESWERLRSFLPASLQTRFVIDSTDTLDTAFIETLNSYRNLAEFLGPEVVAQILVSAGLVKQGGFNRTMQLITPYLGRCARREPTFADCMHVPEAMLRQADIVDLLFNKLRRNVYRRFLSATGGDAQSVQALRKEVESIKKEYVSLHKGPLPVVHQQLFDRVVTYFETILGMEVPSRIVSAFTVKGEPHTFPSLRQRIAMHESQEQQRLLVGFDMGGGKTETAFLAKEHVGAKKMLFICLPGMQEDIAARVHPDYARRESLRKGNPDARMACYKNGQAPTIGIVQALGRKMTKKELFAILENEVVICPYSMLQSGLADDDRKVVDIFKQYGIDEETSSDRRAVKPHNRRTANVSFDFLAVDEVHNARNLDGTFTHDINDLANNIPNLYDHGNIMLMSGDVTPNRPTDVVPQMRILDRDTYSNMRSLSAHVDNTDPLAVRNALLKYWLVLDEPVEWAKYTEAAPFELYPEERALYNALVNNEDLTSTEKMHLLQLCVLNPTLFRSGGEVRSSLLDATLQKLDQYLTAEGQKSVMIAENTAKQGVSREYTKGATSAVLLCDSIRNYLQETYGDTVRFHIIDGDTPDKLREEYLTDTVESENGTSPVKTVVFVMSGCVREGRNFSHMHRAIILEPDFNKPNVAQFVRRFAREGNTDVKIALLEAKDTIHTGIAAHADMKYEVTSAMREGGTYTRNDLAMFDAEHVAQSLNGDSPMALFSPLLNHLQRGQNRLNRMFGFLRGKGVAFCERFFHGYGREFAELYCEHWESSHSANNGRFVASLFEKLEEDGLLSGGRYADIGSGPLALEQTLGIGGNLSHQRLIASVDLCGHMLEQGLTMLRARGPEGYNPYFVGKGSMTDLANVEGNNGLFSDGILDAVNCACSLHYTSVPRRNADPSKNFDAERVRALVEINRALKVGGMFVLTLPARTATPEELQNFRTHALPAFGFEVLPQYSGTGRSTDKNDQGHTFQNITVTCRKVSAPDRAAIQQLDPAHITFTRSSVTTTGKPKEKREPTKLHEGYCHTEFTLGSLDLNFETDERKQEEQHALLTVLNERVTMLRTLYKERGNSFENLTAEDLRNLHTTYGIERISFQSSGDRYTLFMLPERPGHAINPLDTAIWGAMD